MHAAAHHGLSFITAVGVRVPSSCISSFSYAWALVTSVKPVELPILCVWSPVVAAAGMLPFDPLEVGGSLAVGAHVVVGTKAGTS